MTTTISAPSLASGRTQRVAPRPSMVRLVAVEMRRALHRPLVRWMIVLALVLAAFAGVTAFLTSNDAQQLASDPSHPANMTTWYRPGEDGIILTFALFLMIGAAICGASVAGAEWKAGTVTTVLTWEPNRWRLHICRTLSAGVLAFVIGLLLQVVALSMLIPAVLLHGSTAGTDGAWWGALGLVMVRIALVTAMVATLAVSFATVGRNTSAALIVMAAYALVIERLIAGLRPNLARFLIAENVATFVPWRQMESVPFERGPLLALMTLLAYLAVVVALATVSFVRRDIAAST
ncbi:MAG TPA: hypothetical protein VF855_01210 [Acidimicrobiales bacterium]